MARRTLVLLPPSEGKSTGGTGAPWAPGMQLFPDLDAQRALVLDALGADHPARVGPTRPAIERYSGVLYRELDVPTLSAEHRRRLYRNVVILSGLWGAVAPRDPIPDYRLKMGARCEPLGRMSSWWRPHLTEALRPRVRGAVVWDLLPVEHSAALDWNALAPGHRVTIRFLDQNGKTISHWNKLLKGSVVRWLSETGETDPAELDHFAHPQGYRLDRSVSTFGRARTELVLREPIR